MGCGLNCGGGVRYPMITCVRACVCGRRTWTHKQTPTVCIYIYDIDIIDPPARPDARNTCTHLSMDVPAYGDGAGHRLHVALLLQDLLRLCVWRGESIVGGTDVWGKSVCSISIGRLSPPPPADRAQRPIARGHDCCCCRRPMNQIIHPIPAGRGPSLSNTQHHTTQQRTFSHRLRTTDSGSTSPRRSWSMYPSSRFASNVEGGAIPACLRACLRACLPLRAATAAHHRRVAAFAMTTRRRRSKQASGESRKQSRRRRALAA